jgi:hypothetical protein
MNDIVCNYTIARFRPYPETGEFVNVGLVLVCPQLHYFGYQFEQRNYGRITAFFPELDVDVFRSGLRGLRTELERVVEPNGVDEADQLLLRETADSLLTRFRELVRPRESLFQFGEIATVLATDPKQKLRELFQHYIDRQFAQNRELQEKITDS